MLTVAEAQARIRERLWRLRDAEIALEAACGCVCAGVIRSGYDLPPWDKALVDGFAVRSVDGPAEPGASVMLRVVEEIPAGFATTRPLHTGEAARIFTGAPLPQGADAVVMQEEAQWAPESGQVCLVRPIRSGQNRLERGKELRQGQVVLQPGQRIGPIEIGVLASTGHGMARAIPRPRVSIVSTGDELVRAGRDGLKPGHIWESNGPMLCGLAEDQGFRVCHVGLARDEASELKSALQEALRPGGSPVDILILSGGVSVGDRDLVPRVLVELGVEPVFHKVRLKPGKPLWFGVMPPCAEMPVGPSSGTLVFGLPGNPVSALVGFLLFVAPAGHALGGLSFVAPGTLRSRLSGAFSHRGDRPTYHPARVVSLNVRGCRVIEPLAWAGSPDLFTLTRADGFAVFPAGDQDFEAGEVVEFLPLDLRGRERRWES